MSVRKLPMAIPPELARLVEVVTAAARAMKDESREWKRGAIAERWLEFEIEPLVQALSLQAIVDRVADDALDQYINPVRREILPISSDTRILPGQRAQIVTRPQRSAMRIDRLIVPDVIADQFLIHDIRVGNRSQFSQAGSVSAAIFRANQPPDEIRDVLDEVQADDMLAPTFETLQVAMDFVLEIEYVGTNPDGETFRATAIGTGVRDWHDFSYRPPGVAVSNDPIRYADVPRPMNADQRNALLGAWRDLTGTAAESDDEDDDQSGHRHPLIDHFDR